MDTVALEFIAERQSAYARVFSGPDAELVLRDLAKFCRSEKTTFDPDPRVSALLQGRHEVWLRLQQHLRLSPERLYDIYGGPK